MTIEACLLLLLLFFWQREISVNSILSSLYFINKLEPFSWYFSKYFCYSALYNSGLLTNSFIQNFTDLFIGIGDISWNQLFNYELNWWNLLSPKFLNYLQAEKLANKNICLSKNLMIEKLNPSKELSRKNFAFIMTEANKFNVY